MTVQKVNTHTKRSPKLNSISFPLIVPTNISRQQTSQAVLLFHTYMVLCIQTFPFFEGGGGGRVSATHVVHTRLENSQLLSKDPFTRFTVYFFCVCNETGPDRLQPTPIPPPPPSRGGGWVGLKTALNAGIQILQNTAIAICTI